MTNLETIERVALHEQEIGLRQFALANLLQLPPGKHTISFEFHVGGHGECNMATGIKVSSDEPTEK